MLGCEQKTCEAWAMGWRASSMKILDIDDIFIFIVKVNYPGFVLVDVIPLSIPILFPHGVVAPLPPLQDRKHGGVARVGLATLMWCAMRGRE